MTIRQYRQSIGKTETMNINKRHTRVIGAISVLLLIAPIPKLLIDEWTVRVTDQHGLPSNGVRVWQNWENYTFNLSGSSEKYTDSQGTVVFPPQRRFAPIAFWVVKAIANVVGFGAHAGFGTFGRVWIADQEPNDSANLTLLDSGAANCSGDRCTADKLTSELRVALH